MFKVYIPDAVYQDIINTEEKKAVASRTYLYKLLKQQPVQRLSAADSERFKAHPDRVLKNPSALYILDVTPAEALSIQRNYGVMCLSSALPSITPLIDVNDIHRPEKEMPLGRGWDTVLDSVEKLPSNALILIDRYLFSESNAAYGNGFDNVLAILTELLPQQLDKDTKYHVTVIYAKQKEGKEVYTFQEVATQLNDLKAMLNRPYDITMELLRITEGCSIYYDFHDRFILSNYYCVEASHKLAAFDKDVATARQTILPMTLFTESSLSGSSTPPLDAITQAATTLANFSKSLSSLSDHNSYCYAVNGQCMEKCIAIRNRLIK